MTFTSSFQVWSAVTIISVFTMILTAAYLLWMLKRVFYGPFNTAWSKLRDANWREALPLITLAAVIVFVGVFPNFLIDVITPALAALLHGVSSVGIIR
jgi:NADH-quinone oxidoreductase subunit M